MIGTGGRVKILDFGLAKLAETNEADEGATDVRTRAGIVMGTAPYMSPEQVQSQPLDPRSDLFSLGVLFNRTLTGRMPFHGDSTASLFSSILRDEPAPLAGHPRELSRLVLRCLAKKPSDRFETAEQVRSELSKLRSRSVTGDGVAAATRDSKTVVVLPFVNRSADPDNEYFSDGLTEEVIADLARIAALRVISRNSAMALKGTTHDTTTFARELGVSHLLEVADAFDGTFYGRWALFLKGTLLCYKLSYGRDRFAGQGVTFPHKLWPESWLEPVPLGDLTDDTPTGRGCTRTTRAGGECPRCSESHTVALTRW